MAASKTILPAMDRQGPAREAVLASAKALRAGGLIILPTETVYGVAALPGSEDRLYEAKERDRDKPIPLLASGIESVERWGGVFSPTARRLARRYWPGPLTLVLPCGGRTEGFRVPDHAVAAAVLKEVGGVLRVTSANLSGDPAARTVEAAMAALGNRVALALDAGPAPIGVESTVVDTTGDTPRILRTGALSEEAILKRPYVLLVCTGNTCRSPMAEQLLRKWLGPDSEWDVGSAGTSAADGMAASEGSQRAVAEKKLSLEAHRSRRLTQALVDGSDLIVVMTKAHKQAVLQRFPRAEDRTLLLNAFNPKRRDADVQDPIGGSLDLYRKVRDEIDAALPDLVLHLHDLTKR